MLTCNLLGIFFEDINITVIVNFNFFRMLFCTSSLSIFAVCYDLNWCVVIVFELLPNSNWINTIKFQYKFLIFVKIWALISKLVLCECQLSLEIKINIFFRLKNP